MTLDAARARFPECPECGYGVDENDPDRSYYIVDGLHYHATCYEKPLTLNEAIVKVQEIGERMKELRDMMPEDSPDHAVAFQVASLIGEIEGALNIEKQKAERPTAVNNEALSDNEVGLSTPSPLVEANKIEEVSAK